MGQQPSTKRKERVVITLVDLKGTEDDYQLIKATFEANGFEKMKSIADTFPDINKLLEANGLQFPSDALDVNSFLVDLRKCKNKSLATELVAIINNDN